MPYPPRPGLRRRSLLQSIAFWPLSWAAGIVPRAAHAQGVELSTLNVQRTDGELLLEFQTRLSLPRTVEDALRRGVPLYFVAEATLYRPRWYWRDLRMARTRRTWRLAYQPLTSAWRVSLGALTQTYASLPEALAALSAAGRWRVADQADLPAGVDLYLRFRYELDTTQLPSPMQIGLGGQADWDLRAEGIVHMPAAEAAP